ncbi:DENN domain-containing protein 3 isoform X2 [Hydra vulgaris]|uniref:DENN domain-containing protein 3 isoform X2 n=1 Tax=Hydra vulgaris TaxID=6087 RepID=A0ABM4CQY8_HYDVU
MQKNLIDFCVIIGANIDTNLEKIPCENPGEYGPYKQNVLAVLSANEAYFPESYNKIDGHPYYKSNEVICPKLHHDDAKSSNYQTCSTEVLLFTKEVASNLVSFCFPSGGYGYKVSQPVHVSSLVLTNMGGSRSYAVYLTCTREYIAISDSFSEKILCTKSSNSENFPLHIPLCFCLISSFPYFNTMKDCLSTLVPFLKKSEEELLSTIMNLAFCLLTTPVPPPGPLSVQLSLFGIEHIVHPADEAIFRVIDIDLRLPLFILTAEDVAKIISCLFTQQSIIFMAKEYSLLTMVIEAFLTYIDPFKWLFTYIPALPAAHADYIEAPGSFIIGLHSSLHSQVKHVRKDPNSGIVLVDLDKGVVDINSNINVPSMPDLVMQTLVMKLKNCSIVFEMSIVSAPSVFSFEEIKKQKDRFMDKINSDIKEIFFYMLVNLFGDVYNYINDQFFDKDAYLQCKPEDEKAFYREVINSDSFSIFIGDRIKHRDCRDSFLLLSERLLSRKSSTHFRNRSSGTYTKSRSTNPPENQSISLNSVTKETFIYKMPTKHVESLSTGRYYKSHCKQLTSLLQGSNSLSNSLKASYLYLRGFAQIFSGFKIEGLRDLYSLNSLSLDLFPAENIFEVIDNLDPFQFEQIEKEPFYKETAKLRTISRNSMNARIDIQKFNSKLKLDKEEFLRRLATLKITDETAHWLFQVLLSERKENSDCIQPDQFSSFYKMWIYMMQENREVSGVKIDVADRIIKVSAEINTGKGMGRIVLTTKQLLFVQLGAREYSLVAHLCDIKEISKYQQFSMTFSGIQALKIINSDQSIPPFNAGLKEDRNVWFVLLSEMVAGNKASLALSDPMMVDQAANNVFIAQALLAIGFPLSIVAGVCRFSKCKEGEIRSLSDETRESLHMRLYPCEGQRATVMSITYVPANTEFSSTIWCGMGSGVIVVYETEKWEHLFELRSAKSRISCLRYVAINQVWAGSFDSVIYVINTVTTKPEQKLQSHCRSVSDIAVDDSPDTHSLIWSSGYDGQVFCWHSETRKCVTSFTLEGVRTLNQIIPTNDGRLWCITLDKIIVVDVLSDKCPVLKHLSVPNRTEPVHFSCSMKFNEKEIWVGCKSEVRLMIWNTKTFTCEQIELDSRVQICCMLSAGGSVWVGNKDGKVFVMCPITKKIILELNAHTDNVKSICETREGNVVTGSSSKDGQLCVWNTLLGYEVVDGKRIYRKNTVTNLNSTFELVDHFFDV